MVSRNSRTKSYEYCNDELSIHCILPSPLSKMSLLLLLTPLLLLLPVQFMTSNSKIKQSFLASVVSLKCFFKTRFCCCGFPALQQHATFVH